MTRVSVVTTTWEMIHLASCRKSFFPRLSPSRQGNEDIKKRQNLGGLWRSATNWRTEVIFIWFVVRKTIKKLIDGWVSALINLEIPFFYFLTVTHVPISSRHHLTLKLDNRDRRRWRESEERQKKVLDPFFGRLLLLDLMEINVREILHHLAIQILRERVLWIQNAAF